MHKPKNLIVVTSDIKNKGGGSHIRLIELIDELARAGWIIHHVSPDDFKDIHRHGNIIHHGFHSPVKYRILPWLIYFLRAPFIIFKILRSTKIDVMLTFSLYIGFLFAVYKVIFRDIKMVIFLRGDDIAGILVENRNRLKKLIITSLYRFIEKVALSKADLVLFISRYVEKSVIYRVGKKYIKKHKVIYNNVNSPRIMRHSKQKKINWGHNTKVVGYIGYLHKGKGIEYLIQAFNIVRKKIKNILLVIVGDGPNRENLLALVEKLGINNKVIFLDYKRNVFPYIKSFDLMVLPSLHEGFGNVICEALYCGTPVIGSKVGGIREALLYEDLLFKPGDVKELSDKLLKILGDPNAYARISELCNRRKKALTFDWGKRVISSIMKILEQ